MQLRLSPPWAWPVIGCAATAIVAGQAVAAQHPEFFRAYFGVLGPAVVLTALAVVGLVSIAALRAFDGFFEVSRFNARVLVRGAWLVSAFAGSAILVDIALRFPRDINVEPPWSTLFYPAMGFAAEVAFHAAPLAVVCTIFRPRGRALLAAMALVALIEPIFQIRGARAADGLTLFVVAQVFAFNLFELYVFRRYGFVAMYGVRLGYYLCWHIAWGALRLLLLF